MSIPEREVCSITDYVIKEERLKMHDLDIQFKKLVKEQEKVSKTTTGFFRKD